MTGDVAEIMAAIERGDPVAAEQLLPFVYDELRKLAAAHIAREAPGQTLQATALVHEAYVRLVGQPEAEDEDADVASSPRFRGRAHFFAAAAEAMRRILVDRARARRTDKRGGKHARADLDVNALAVDTIRLDAVPVELIDLDEALRRLEVQDPVKAQLVTLRFFGGLTMKEAAAIQGLSLSTVERHWAQARAWLGMCLSRGD